MGGRFTGWSFGEMNFFLEEYVEENVSEWDIKDRVECLWLEWEKDNADRGYGVKRPEVRG